MSENWRRRLEVDEMNGEEGGFWSSVLKGAFVVFFMAIVLFIIFLMVYWR